MNAHARQPRTAEARFAEILAQPENEFASEYCAKLAIAVLRAHLIDLIEGIEDGSAKALDDALHDVTAMWETVDSACSAIRDERDEAEGDEESEHSFQAREYYAGVGSMA